MQAACGPLFHGRWAPTAHKARAPGRDKQAERLGQALRTYAPFAAIYSSDLQRTMDTAEPIAQACRMPVSPEPGLRERRFGDFEGFTFTELELRLPQDTARWRERDPEWSPPGGEALRAVRERITQTVDRLAERHIGEQIVLVTHGGVLDALYRVAAHLDIQAPRTWQLGNASINRLRQRSGSSDWLSVGVLGLSRIASPF